MRLTHPCAAALLLATATACDSCYGPINRVEHVRHVKRIQPGAPEATYGPTRPLEWGQLNVLHTADGADFGDFISFATHMKERARSLGVDLLLIDTGDLHDGTGLSDTTTPDGELSSRVFTELQAYDLLTIGNHELYLADVAYQTFNSFSTPWGDKYLTSNVQIQDPKTNEWDHIGKTHRYFTTENGLRIMAFGVLYDFTGNTNVTKVITAKDMVRQPWFVDAIHTTDPVDLFLLIGHNIARPSTPGSTFQIVHHAIRAVHPTTPIQIFGGHSHIRDFAVVDASSTALESGRYCETVGWFSMSGFNQSNSGRNATSSSPCGVPNPSRPAVIGNSSATADPRTTSRFLYSRRYLDWNRYTFQYHTVGNGSFDLAVGLNTTKQITSIRAQQRLGTVYGCVPEFYCQTCVPSGNPSRIFTLLSGALSETVVRSDRNTTARMIFASTGSVRFDMYKGPFTYDDNFIVSPFRNVFRFVADVPFADANSLLDQLNSGSADKRDVDVNMSGSLFGSIDSRQMLGREACVDPVVGLTRRGDPGVRDLGIARRKAPAPETPGYTTIDDCGTDGDDTKHSTIPRHPIPNYFMASGGFPEDGSPDKVDVIFVDFIEPYVLSYLGPSYSAGQVAPYISENFTSQDYLLPFVEKHWQANIADCPL
ncbi:hypothetical protein SCUCBS95973_007459 [Sporothrix curviconia]|uniref:Calcineurin-like phosphoesterase domain-containing protein n=1 Tax=Sporothrix curviconia TaxID=1260050 RepID=A0ABP0CDG8_9PEZI